MLTMRGEDVLSQSGRRVDTDLEAEVDQLMDGNIAAIPWCRWRLF